MRSASRGVEALAGQGVAAGVAQADGVDHVGGDRGGRDADADFGDAELRVGRGEGDVDAADDADAAAETGAVHQGDGRLRELVQQLHRAGGGDGGGVVLRRRIVGDLAQPPDVGAGLEVLAGAADDQAADGRVGGESGQARDQAVQHGGVVGVADLRAVEGDGGDAVRRRRRAGRERPEPWEGFRSRWLACQIARLATEGNADAQHPDPDADLAARPGANRGGGSIGAPDRCRRLVRRRISRDLAAVHRGTLSGAGRRWPGHARGTRPDAGRGGYRHRRLAVSARSARPGAAAEMVPSAAGGGQQPAARRSVGQRRDGDDLARVGQFAGDRRVCRGRDAAPRQGPEPGAGGSRGRGVERAAVPADAAARQDRLRRRRRRYRARRSGGCARRWGCASSARAATRPADLPPGFSEIGAAGRPGSASCRAATW